MQAFPHRTLMARPALRSSLLQARTVKRVQRQVMSSQSLRNSELTVGLPTLRFFAGWAPPICVRLATKLYTTPTISLTSLPYLRDNQYIVPAQCWHLFITPLFQRFYL